MLLDNWNIVSASTVLSAEPQDPRIYVASVLSPARGCVIWETSALTLSTNKKPRNEAAALLLLSKYLLLVSTAVLLFLKSHNLELDLPPCYTGPESWGSTGGTVCTSVAVMECCVACIQHQERDYSQYCPVTPGSPHPASPSHTNVVLGRK